MDNHNLNVIQSATTEKESVMKTERYSVHNPRPVPDDIGDYLSYNSYTGEISWSKSRGRVKVGDPAGIPYKVGTHSASSYIKIRFKGKSYQANRVAWFLHYGEQPPVHMEYLNGDPTDNSIRNLRERVVITEHVRNPKRVIKKTFFTRTCRPPLPVVEHVLYNTWLSMKGRCKHKNHPSYEKYGAKGIKVCKRWSDFFNFVEDMGDKPTPNSMLSRFEDHLDYRPENCMWSFRNKGRPSELIEYRGMKFPLKEWAKRLGIKYVTLHQRLKTYGWSIEKAFETGVTKRIDSYTHGDETMTAHQWAKKLRVKPEAVDKRLSVGWSIGKIIEAVQTARSKKLNN